MQTAYRPTSFSAFPPVIKNLLILNGLVFLATMVPTTQMTLFSWFALWPLGTYDPVVQFWPWQLVTYGFLHGGFTHILFNMFALWMFGATIENLWGSRRFGIYYFVCVIGAGLVQLFVATMAFENGGRPFPTVGASGGVMGVLLAFGMMFPDREIMLLFPPIPIKAKYFVAGYAALDLYMGVANTQSGVAHFAHLAGMAFGLAMILYWRGKLPLKPKERMM